MNSTNPIPLAIVGIGCRFPGDATNPEKLWDLLANGKSAWSKVPADRWNEEAFLHPDPDDTNGTHNHVGGHFLKQDISEFDASFFNVLPQEAAAMVCFRTSRCFNQSKCKRLLFCRTPNNDSCSKPPMKRWKALGFAKRTFKSQTRPSIWPCSPEIMTETYTKI